MLRAGFSVTSSPESVIFHAVDWVDFGRLLASSHSAGDFEFNTDFMVSPSRDELCLKESPDLGEQEAKFRIVVLPMGNEIHGIGVRSKI